MTAFIYIGLLIIYCACVYIYISQVDTALIYDAVLLFAKALHELDRNQNVYVKSLNCEGTDSWAYGHNLINYMKLVCERIIVHLLAVRFYYF